MDINALKTSLEVNGPAFIPQTTSRTLDGVSIFTAATGVISDKQVSVPTSDKVAKKPAELQDVTQMTEAMNKFVEAINSNIRFTVHQKTNELMVQVVDQTNNKILKEFPPHEFLDTIAAIRSYVGILLDKKI